MALDTYAALKTSVLGWLARPGDPLVEPAIPDMIRLFEAEASRRLRVGHGEKQVTLTTTPGTSRIVLPADFVALRQIACSGRPLTYLPPGPVPQTTGGEPMFFSITGPATTGVGSGYRLARIDPTPQASHEITILYLSGPPPLGDANPTNWLLARAPDAYLFGTLSEAELYIGHDERAPLWMQRRDAAFASIEQADRSARWPGGGQLQIRVHGITTGWQSGGGGATTSSGGTPPPVVPPVVVPPPSGSGGANVHIGETRPATAAAGDLWWDSSSAAGGGQLYIYYIDPTGIGQWTAATNQQAAAAGVVSLTPASGNTILVSAEAPNVYISSFALAALTIRLPPTPPLDGTVQVSFANPVEKLTVQDSYGVPVIGAPDNAYGPGSALVFRHVPPGIWTYWK